MKMNKILLSLMLISLVAFLGVSVYADGVDHCDRYTCSVK